MNILLVASLPGNVRALRQLEPFWGEHRHLWVASRSSVTASDLAGEPLVWAHGPTTRNPIALLRNVLLALRLMLRERPGIVLACGAGVTVPFLIVGRLCGARTVFIESINRIESLSLTARLSLPFLSVLYVHWPQLQRLVPRAVLITPMEAP